MDKKVPKNCKALYICKVFLLSQDLIAKYYFSLHLSARKRVQCIVDKTTKRRMKHIILNSFIYSSNHH